MKSYRFGPLLVDTASRRLLVGGVEQHCSARVFDLLQLLCEHPRTVFSRNDLIRALWPARLGSDESLSQVLFKLRAAMGESAHHLITVRGVGVRLDADVESVHAAPAEPVRVAFSAHRRPGKRGIFAALGVVAVGLVLGAAMFHSSNRENPLLLAYGLEGAPPRMNDAANKLLLDALRTDAAGRRQEAIALLKSAHAADEHTAVPALLLTIWLATAKSPDGAREWLTAATNRSTSGPAEQLYADLARAITETNERDTIGALGGLIEAHPAAWKLRLARARYRAIRGEDLAALADLDAIPVRSLDDPSSAQVLIKRASLGQLEQVRAAYARLPHESTAPYALVGAELAYIAGDFTEALPGFRRAAELARRQGVADVEYQAEILGGLLASLAGLHEEAVERLNSAVRLAESLGRPLEQIDALLLLSQATAEDPATRDEALARAKAKAIETGDPAWSTIVGIVALRLGAPSDLATAPAGRLPTLEALEFLLQAWRFHAAGNGEPGRAMLRKAVAAGILSTPAAPEAHAAARSLGLRLPRPAKAAEPVTDMPFFPLLCSACRPGT